MKNSTVFTSSIKSSLMDRLKKYSEDYKIPKNKIIEDALKRYFDEIKKAELEHAFKMEKYDHEIISLAEEGIDDFLDIIKRYE